MLRLVRILTIAAFLVQTSPLRACAWEEALLGGSCHDSDFSLTIAGQEQAASVDGCDGHPQDPSGRTCVCEVQPQPARKSAAPAAPNVTFTPLLADLFSIPDDTQVVTLRASTLLALPAPSPQNSLPLLN